LDANLIAGLQGIFRPRASLHIGSLRDGGGQELAQMPLVRRWTRVGPIPVRQLEAGPRNQASVTDLLVDPDSPDAALGFLHALRRQPGWDLLECRAVVAGGSLARAATTIGATVRPD